MKNTLPLLILSLILFPAMLRAQIITNPDSAVVHLYETILVDVLANDYELGNDSIYLSTATSSSQLVSVINNRYVRLIHQTNWHGKSGWLDPISYSVRQVNGPHIAHGVLHVNLINESYADLDINNLSARFNALGNHLWDFGGKPMFFAPKNSGKSPMYNCSFWIGGIESTSDQLHVSAERYRQVGVDFYSGPVSAFYHSLYDREWSRVWKLTTYDIHHHIANYASPGYTPIRDIAEWPAHGDTVQGQLWQMAPFHDSNNNGIYEPMAGDYPLIRGDMALFFIFNDIRHPNTESGGIPLGVEVHGMAYAFDRPSDSLLNNTIFLHYDIINRSQNQYNDTWIGLWFDPDLGFAYDDYIGTHVEHGAIYVYNAYPVDGSGQTWAYGEKPPVLGMQFLAGPYMDPDGLDNPKTDSLGNPLCDVSLNGANFGDGIVDNERFGLTRTLRHLKTMFSILHQPVTAGDYYNSLRGFWRDSTKLFYGGNGHPNLGGYGPVCDFMFPGYTDPCNLGTGGLPPNGPFLWTEQTTGNQPWDAYGMASTGPFTFMPNERQELDVAFIFARDQVHDKSYDTLVDWMGRLKSLFVNTPGMFDPVISVSATPRPQQRVLKLYPNPALDHITISGLTSQQPAVYHIFSITGQQVAAGKVHNHEPLTVAHLTPGIYIIRLLAGNDVVSRKFVKE